MAFIQLTKGLETLIDDESFDELNRFNWYASGPIGFERPARRLKEEGRKLIYIYHQILGVKPWLLAGVNVDHINRDPLDNRRSNLRLVSRSENMQNRAISSKGISVDRTHGTYKAYIGHGVERVNVGTFQSYEEAEEARQLFLERHQQCYT